MLSYGREIRPNKTSSRPLLHLALANPAAGGETQQSHAAMLLGKPSWYLEKSIRIYLMAK